MNQGRVQRGQPLEHPLPAGMRDFLPEEADRRRRLSRKLLDALERFGYALVVPPAFEFAEVLERGLGALSASDMLRFIEPESGEVAALRPDMTPQVARMLATRLVDRPPPFRLAYEGTVLRRRTGRARKHRQIPQVGVELAGKGGIEGDLEILEVASAALEAAGLEHFTIDVGHAGIAKPLIDALPAPVREEATAALMAKDADWLAALTGSQGEALATLAREGTSRDELGKAIARASLSSVRDALERLAAIYDGAQRQGIARHVTLDLGEVRGFAYYTGMIFRIYAPGPGEALGGGGRYDELMGRFGAPMPAVGFGVDLDLLAAALRAASGPAGAATERLLVTGPLAGEKARQLRSTGVCAAVHEDATTADAHAKAWGYSSVVVTKGDG